MHPVNHPTQIIQHFHTSVYSVSKLAEEGNPISAYFSRLLDLGQIQSKRINLGRSEEKAIWWRENKGLIIFPESSDTLTVTCVNNKQQLPRYLEVISYNCSLSMSSRTRASVAAVLARISGRAPSQERSHWCRHPCRWHGYTCTSIYIPAAQMSAVTGACLMWYQSCFVGI
jgi:hypothetical protein